MESSLSIIRCTTLKWISVLGNRDPNTRNVTRIELSAKKTSHYVGVCSFLKVIITSVWITLPSMEIPLILFFIK